MISLIELKPERRLDWNAFYNHPLFRSHQQVKPANDMTKSIMFRVNQDTVNKLFDINKGQKEGEYDLNMDPSKLINMVNNQFPPAIGFQDPNQKPERFKQKILDRFTHEKRIMVFII